MLKLEEPSMKYISSFINAVEEGFSSHMALSDFDALSLESLKSEPEQYLLRLNSKETQKIITPDKREFNLYDHDIYWLTDGFSKFIGGVSIRYDKDCDLISKCCGHVGINIRKTLQGMGYGSEALKLIFNIVKSRKLLSFLMSCSPSNKASRNLIKKFGGKLVSINDFFGYGDMELYVINI